MSPNILSISDCRFTKFIVLSMGSLSSMNCTPCCCVCCGSEGANTSVKSAALVNRRVSDNSKLSCADLLCGGVEVLLCATVVVVPLVVLGAASLL